MPVDRIQNRNHHNVRTAGVDPKGLNPTRKAVYDFAHTCLAEAGGKNAGFIFDGKQMPVSVGDAAAREKSLHKHGITDVKVVDSINHVVAGLKGGFAQCKEVEVSLEKVKGSTGHDVNVVAVHGTDKTGNEFVAFLDAHKGEEYLRGAFHTGGTDGGSYEFHHA